MDEKQTHASLIGQLVRFEKICFKVELFTERPQKLASQLLEQGFGVALGVEDVRYNFLQTWRSFLETPDGQDGLDSKMLQARVEGRKVFRTKYNITLKDIYMYQQQTFCQNGY